MAMLEEPGFAGLGPRISPRELVPVPRLAGAVWLRNARVFSKLWRGALLPTFADPFLYLLAMGFGLGTYIATINGIPYKEFIAPGLIASRWHRLPVRSHPAARALRSSWLTPRSPWMAVPTRSTW